MLFRVLKSINYISVAELRINIALMLELRNIHKTYYGTEVLLHVLKGVNLSIEEGEFICIMGASGSGKSTLLDILGILDTYDEGDYLLDGVSIKDLANITKHLNFRLEQVQDFTPTPMTISTEMWYTGLDPYTLRPVFSARSPKEKLAQRQYFFWYKKQ